VPAPIGERGRARRLLAARVGLVHLLLQLVAYAVAFALGPEGATREVAGVSLYRVAEVLTFPLVTLAERVGVWMIGPAIFPLNSALWALAAYWLLVGVDRLRGEERRR
jgi:hypothetical protein